MRFIIKLAIKHYKIVFVCLVWLALAGYSHYNYRRGYSAGVNAMQIKLNAEIDKHAKAMAKISRDYQELKSMHEREEKLQYAKLQKIVEDPVYRNNCLSTGGLSELNRAIKRK